MTPVVPEKPITKSKYISALQCAKRLWMEENASEHVKSPSAMQLHALEQGTRVGRLAREQFADGLLIRGYGRIALQATQTALQEGVNCLFEAAFSSNDVSVRCDVLRRIPSGEWELIEVKAATRLKEIYLHDLAVQAYAVERAGLKLARIVLMHVNNRAVFPELGRFFVMRDVTAEVRQLLPEVRDRLNGARQTLASDVMPDVCIGAHCDRPRTCPLKTYCWQDVPTPSIFSIPRLSGEKADDLVSQGVLRLEDIPEDYPLSAAQWAYVRRALCGEPHIDHAGIRHRMAKLVYPIYFLDFESDSSAIPWLDGTRPYQQVPFQYSCHILSEDGTVTHRAYLHEEASDPRPSLSAALHGDIGSKGSIVVYNAQFERSILMGLAGMAGTPRKALRSMAGRLWDQLVIFRRFYRDPLFEGSTSIKMVLPVLVPGLSYSGLAVRNGGEAQAVWNQMIECEEPRERDRLASELREYCKLDTLAMLEIHRVLHELGSNEPTDDRNKD